MGKILKMLGDILFALSINLYNQRCLNKIVEKGTRPVVETSDDELIPRPEIIERLKKIFQPCKSQSSYHMVCGEHGTGKTTLIKIASNEVGCGVIYVDIPANLEELGEAFGRAINFASVDHVSLLGRLMDKPKISEWGSAIRALDYASEVYKAKHDKPMVIVYDNISHLVHKNPDILDILQDNAKHSADDRKYITVFVSSEGSVPRRMQLIEIGDLTEEESMDYLVKKRGIKNIKDAEKIYGLVGGRIVDLKNVADDFCAGKSFEVVKQDILMEVEDKLRTANLLKNYQHYEVGKHVMNVLLRSKELSRIAYEEFFNEPAEAHEILEANIFSYHPEKNIVTFQSRSVEFYVKNIFY
ncbi:P-loop containing nucleoside triphosphate hydrolase protein [Glomus cerebriforme]|uniref:P-loop containing nucleoside triphosphate hydrolase protein n=1 Tax=Glomus cerebriforme TaxID=658196 RepID=A0A397T2F9_9GLOM|nr:P-loop containing nucleoside triphosphate hydrolase protein [Glomus cerebriforme]